ncbi:MAG: HAMP domain-containing histidine kinase [Deltaproteobacteria bacterium]|nr:HAMP domain-containing histidine kinase [Deltaproteobacteria bacterium]
MSSRGKGRSISGPIILSSIAVVLTAALLVGWILVIYRNQVLTENWEGNAWLMVTGIVSFVLIMAVLVSFSVFLAREIKEVRRQTSFIDSVTHELRSPLASLRLCLQTLDRGDLQSAQRNDLREMMLGDVERLSAFIDDILESSRLGHEAGGRPIEPVALAAVVARCVSTTAKRHRMDPSTITVQMPPDTVLYTDPVALEVILRNLLDNAAKYSDPPRTVGLEAGPGPKGGFRIVVRDNGVGIPRRELKRVFERFYRVDDESVRSRRGTGLGLYVVAALVRGLGARLRAHSDGPGCGTRIQIDLPIRRPRPTLDGVEVRAKAKPAVAGSAVALDEVNTP